MIELAFIACLAINTNGAMENRCRQYSLLYTGVTSMQCVMGAQPELAKWIETHPRHRIKGWKCRPAQTAAQKV